MLFHLEKKNQEIMAALQYKPSESHQRVIRESSEREERERQNGQTSSMKISLEYLRLKEYRIAWTKSLNPNCFGYTLPKYYSI
jgi:hypothetical protein